MIANDYFLVNKTKPYLIEKNIINKILKTNIEENNKIYTYLRNLAYDFIKKNIVIVIIIIIVILFFSYRYLNYYNYSKIYNETIKFYINNNTEHLNTKKISNNYDRKVIDISNTKDILDYYN